MDKYVSLFDLSLDGLIKILKDLGGCRSLGIKERKEEVRELHLRVIQVVHAQRCSDDWIGGGVPVRMWWEWRKLRLEAEARSPR
jgi:hypothetical protein